MEALTFAFVAGACEPKPEAAAVQCPPCECVCKWEGQGPAVAQGSPELGELVAAASRKLAHGDGQGCLVDLDRVRELDARLDERLSITRGQCEMLVGACQQGKQRIARWYEVETAMTPERAAITAESLASMHCQGGDASARDRMLRALFDLSDGAYMNTRTSEFCRERVTQVRKLWDEVVPREHDDEQLRGGKQALFHTAAACFARAGDCKGAREVFREFFPAEGLAAIQDPAQREAIVDQGFASAITRCASG